MEPTARENLLRLIAGKPDSALADFAKDVLAGRRALRDLVHTSVAAEEVTQSFQPALDAWAKAAEAEREAAIARAPEVMAQFSAELAALKLDTPKPPPPPEDDDWSEWSVRDHTVESDKY